MIHVSCWVSLICYIYKRIRIKSILSCYVTYIESPFGVRNILISMDGISMASIWSNQQDQAEERFMISNSSNCYNSYGGKTDPTEDLFYPVQVLKKAQISPLNSNLERVSQLASTQIK